MVLKATFTVVKLKKSILSIKLASDKVNLWETQQKLREGMNQNRQGHRVEGSS